MQLDWEKEEIRDNALAGTVGAFLGSLIGVACIVLVQRLGYVSAVGGLVMAVCAIKGYTMLAGRFSKRGAVISGLMILVMTFVSCQTCFALEIMSVMADEGGVDFFTAYRAVFPLLEEPELRRAFIGELVLLYLFTLIGALPQILAALREPRDQAEARETAEELEDATAKLNAVFYPFRKDWMRPLRLSVFVPTLIMMVLLLGGWFALSAMGGSDVGLPVMMAMMVAIILLFLMTLPTIRLCNTFTILYVRAGEKLWQVDLYKLAGVQDWEKLTPSRKAVVRNQILREIRDVAEGRGLDMGSIFREVFGEAWPEQKTVSNSRSFQFGKLGSVTLLEDLQVEKENNWSWKVSYTEENGKRKKLTIPKGYPGFCPGASIHDPALETPPGPVPVRWSMTFAALVVMVAVVGSVFAFGKYQGTRPASPSPEGTQGSGQQEAQVPAEPKEVPVRTPASSTGFVLSEVSFWVDSEFDYSQRTFLDGETGTLYRTYVQYGVDESDAWDTLSQDIGKYRTSQLYDRFEAVYLDTVPLTERDGDSRYNILSVYLTDGWVYHTAVVLSDDGTLFTMEAQHDSAKESVEDVMGNLMYTLNSVRFEGPAVSEENYQSQIHVAEGWGCEYMATAYIKTDIFGHDAFVDVYLPYSDAPIYASDGTAVRTEAHGLRMHVTIQPGENAKAVVDARFQELAAKGQVYEDGAADELYREDMDAACRLTVYEEDGETRYAVLYADAKWDGYYLLREITGLPELVDEEYPALLAELEEVIGLTVPALEELAQG